MAKISSRRFKALLALRGISQKEIAAMTGLSRITINNVCSGRQCTKRTAERIIKALGIDEAVILEEGGEDA